MTMASRRRSWLLAGVILLSVNVFLLDLFLPLGVAVGALYTVPVILSLWLPGRPVTIATAAACTVLTLMETLFSSPGVLWIGLVNRGIILLLIWAVMLIVLLRKRADEQIKTLQGLIPICASCKKIRNDHGYWDVLEMYIQKHSEAQFTHGICPQCAERFYDGTITQNTA
jgi:hypothetical protein